MGARVTSLKAANKRKRRRVWYVANRNAVMPDGKMLTLRGPYKHAETAAAVRAEMERAEREGPAPERGLPRNKKTWNLRIVWEWEEV